MEKKFKISDKSLLSKIIYGAVIAILCITAIVIGIVAANNRKKTDAPKTDEGTSQTDDKTDEKNNGKTEDETGGKKDDEKKTDDKKNEPLTMLAPVVGRIAKSHSTTTPVFSNTLEEYRIHTGVDISTEDGAKVYAAAAGTVSAVYTDPMLGCTVVIRHNENVKSVYSNLAPESVKGLAVGQAVAAGEMIAEVGDSSISEMCDETHLHFEVKVQDASVNPLDYITEAAQKASLGIIAEKDV